MFTPLTQILIETWSIPKHGYHVGGRFHIPIHQISIETLSFVEHCFKTGDLYHKREENGEFHVLQHGSLARRTKENLSYLRNIPTSNV